MNKKRVLKNMLRGQSLSRALMNEGLSLVSLMGKVLDVGGARNPDYFHYFQKKGEVHIDIIDGSFQKIDFEKDPLPYATDSYNAVVVCNVLEHIFNYQFLVGEMHRVLKKDGILVGYVPFFFQYHPDPHDYFRYTGEALQKILTTAGFSSIDVKKIGRGPFFVNFNILMHSIPVPLRLFVFPFYALSDWFFLKLRPKARERFPLGYLFVAKK